MLLRKCARMIDPRLECIQQRIDVVDFLTDAREQFDICVACQARFAPMLDGNAADERKAPLSSKTECLDFERRLEQPARFCHADAIARKAAASPSVRSISPRTPSVPQDFPARACPTPHRETPPASGTRAREGVRPPWPCRLRARCRRVGVERSSKSHLVPFAQFSRFRRSMRASPGCLRRRAAPLMMSTADR